MRFHADLHVHSKYSRATSRDLDLEHLAAWACRKGIAVVATGDFTHPAWLAELKQKLVPAEPGLFRLHTSIEQDVARTLPAACQTSVRFMLSVEISTIYKKWDRTRKIHHLLYAPDFDTADRIVARLARIGNLASDGRPILGLDSRHLLEIVLESHPAAYLVPAHIWTPWFAALGSRSGFDSIGECYGDLSEHIFALETGLSSDPPMNWRVSSLDRYRLTSNSDAHSPGKLGRETTQFDTALDYFAIRRALETGTGYVGTVEFFPEEGKYHMDGHRRCNVRLTPSETRERGERCPVCGEPMTIGVLHRVETLADRPEGDVTPPATAGEVSNLVPLPEILAELLGSGASSKAVERSYDRLIARLGPELSILNSIPTEDIARADSTLLAEAIQRLRAGQVIRDAGYDGAYGVIRLFDAAELQRHTVGGTLFDLTGVTNTPGTTAEIHTSEIPPSPATEDPHGRPQRGLHGDDATPHSGADVRRAHQAGAHHVGAHHVGAHHVGARQAEAHPAPAPVSSTVPPTATTGILAQLDDDQRMAAGIAHGPLLILAGPGSGKTRTLTHRIAHLITEHSVPAASCLAITFTRRAAAEMRDRLVRLVPAVADHVPIHTFHSLGLAILQEQTAAAGLQRGFRIAEESERVAVLMERLHCSERKARSMLRAISTCKRTQQHESTDLTEALHAYQHELAARNWIDFDDLIGRAVQILTTHAELAELYRDRFRYISVDEFQDVDAQQYQLLALLAPPGANLCVIGDPNQAIYGFRGADAACFDHFRDDYPDATVVTLKRNYRSSGTIVTAAAQVIAPARETPSIAEVTREMLARITIHTAPTERGEAEFVVRTIENIIGGHSFFSIDSGRATAGTATDCSFADFAVLYRTDAQSIPLCDAFARSGMPFQKHGHEPLVESPVVRAIMQELHREADGTADTRPLLAQLAAAADRVMHHDPSHAFTPAMLQTAVQQLTILAEMSAGDHERFINAVVLATEADTWDPRADRVSLLTLHAAKGLEFPVVFIVGLEDGILPLHWGDGARDAATEREERRLCYVGMTRAKDRLLLSRARQRQWHGRARALDTSPFLSDIEQILVQHEQPQPSRRKPDDTQLALL